MKTIQNPFQVYITNVSQMIIAEIPSNLLKYTNTDISSIEKMICDIKEQYQLFDYTIADHYEYNHSEKEAFENLYPIVMKYLQSFAQEL